MNLQFFPMDRQLCSIEIESCKLSWTNNSIVILYLLFYWFVFKIQLYYKQTVGFGMSEIIYDWQGGSAAVAVQEDVQLPQFDVVGYRQTNRVISLTTGKKFDIWWNLVDV